MPHNADDLGNYTPNVADFVIYLDPGISGCTVVKIFLNLSFLSY